MGDPFYHCERLDTHGMVLDRCADLEHSDSMIYTMKKVCLEVPVSARRVLLPLNGRGRLAGDIVGHAGDAIDLVDDAA